MAEEGRDTAISKGDDDMAASGQGKHTEPAKPEPGPRQKGKASDSRPARPWAAMITRHLGLLLAELQIFAGLQPICAGEMCGGGQRAPLI